MGFFRFGLTGLLCGGLTAALIRPSMGRISSSTLSAVVWFVPATFGIYMLTFVSSALWMNQGDQSQHLFPDSLTMSIPKDSHSSVMLQDSLVPGVDS